MISQHLFKIKDSCSVYELTMTKYIVRYRMGHLLFVLPFSVHIFSSKISPQMYKIEKSYLVYRLSTTSFIVGYRTDILLLSIIKFFIADFSENVRHLQFSL